MNQKTKRKAETPEKIRIFCLGMILALAGLTGCGRQEVEFYTQEELADAAGDGTQEDTAGEEKQGGGAAETASQAETSAAAESGYPAAAQNETAAEETVSASETALQETAPARIFVDVCGAVASPGVYELEADSRVFQAIELAGGYLPEAAQSYLNRAGVLADGQQIYVPTQAEVDENPEKFSGETAASASGESVGADSDGTGAPASGETAKTAFGEAASGQADETASGSGKVNLNTADLSELTILPGIGETKAQAIIAYREANGNFQSIEDLMKVDGIKEGTYAKLKDQITVD